MHYYKYNKQLFKTKYKIYKDINSPLHHYQLMLYDSKNNCWKSGMMLFQINDVVKAVKRGQIDEISEEKAFLELL